MSQTTSYSQHEIQTCVNALKAGHCIAYPTEGVWGLGCDPNNKVALEEILRIKQRPIEKGLILIASDIAHFEFLLNDLPLSILDKMKARWPGHVTWLVPHKNRVSTNVSGNSDKVAIRVSAHPLVQALGQAYSAPFISTSANPAGLPAAETLEQVKAYFSSEPKLVFAPGEVGVAQGPSTIIDADTGKILRP